MKNKFEDDSSFDLLKLEEMQMITAGNGGPGGGEDDDDEFFWFPGK